MTYKPSEFGYSIPETDVRSASRHICRNGHCPRVSGAGNDSGLEFIVARIQNFMRNSIELPAQTFGFFHTGRADKNRLARLMDTSDLLNERGLLFLSGAKNDVR